MNREEIIRMAREALESMLESIHPYREDGTPTIPDATIELVNAAIAAIEAKLREKNHG